MVHVKDGGGGGGFDAITALGGIGAAVGAVGGLLTEIAVDEGTKQKIMKILTESIDDVGKPVGAVPQAAFGGSPTGTTLGFHTDLAHQKLSEAMLNITAGLTGYRESVAEYAALQTEVDEESRAASTRTMDRVAAAETCITKPAVPCALPPQGGDN